MNQTTMTEQQFLRTKEVVLAHLSGHEGINNHELRALGHLGKHQATRFFGRMVGEGYLRRTGKGSATKYVLPGGVGEVSD